MLLMIFCSTASAFSERYLGSLRASKREYEVMYSNMRRLRLSSDKPVIKQDSNWLHVIWIMKSDRVLNHILLKH